MALEELLGERAEKIKGHDFCIDPKSKYDKDSDRDRAEFVRRADNLFDVEDYFFRLSKNIGDMKAIQDFAGIAKHFMVGTPEENESLLYENPHLALEQAESLYSSGSFSMAKYVERNRDEIFDELEELGAEHLYKIFLRTPIFKRYHASDSASHSSITNSSTYSYEIDDKEYERIRKLKEKVELMQRASQEGGDISSVVQEELGELVNKAPGEQRIFIMRNQHLVIPSLTKSLVRIIQEEFGSLFRDKERKLDSKKLRDYLEDNYRSVRNFIENEIPEDKEKEKFQYWDDNLKMPYLEVARELFGPKKKQDKMESDDDKVVEKEERKTLAEKMGMRT